MPVVIAPIGKPLKVIKILTDEKTKKHLESLGITINSELKSIKKLIKPRNTMAYFI